MEKSIHCWDKQNFYDEPTLKKKKEFSQISVKTSFQYQEPKQNSNLKEERNKFLHTITTILSLIALVISLIAIITVNDYTTDDVKDDVIQKISINKGDFFNAFKRSCKNITKSESVYDGVYYLRDSANTSYPAYCDMSTDGGGWTLVATIHENNLGEGGRCSIGDKWSNEQGNSLTHGGGNWANRNIFGHVVSATSADYKNQAYFDVQASDVMIWQVPNVTPLSDIKSSAYLRYRTSNGFMSSYGNLFQLFNDHFPLKSGFYEECGGGNGPSIEVSYDVGNESSTLNHYGPSVRNEIQAGHIQFRAVGQSGDSYALCLGVKPRDGACKPQHYCVGTVGKSSDETHCGDFASFDADGYGTGLGSSTDKELTESVFMIFYR